MLWTRVRSIGVLILFICILVKSNAFADRNEEYEDNIDSYEEVFVREHGLDNHDIDDDDLVDQGYVVDEDNGIPEQNHEEVNHHGDHDMNLDSVGGLNPEILEQIEHIKKKLNHQTTDTSAKSNVDDKMDELLREVSRLDTVDKNYRTSISALLATTAELRIQIIKLNDTIKRLEEQDQAKDARIKDLENVVENIPTTCNKYSEDKKRDEEN